VLTYVSAICLGVLFSVNAASPAACSYFKNQYYPEPFRYDTYSAPALVNCSLPGLAVTELTGTDYVVAARGDIFNVSLMETDPRLNWEFIGGEGVYYMGNSLIETYPVRHNFKLKANYTCAVLFKMIDDRDFHTVKTFKVNLVVAPPLSGLGWPALSPDLVPSFGWPPRQKFG
jgi:hypothetical protein